MSVLGAWAARVVKVDSTALAQPALAKVYVYSVLHVYDVQNGEL